MNRKFPKFGSIRRFDCRKCGISTLKNGEYYSLSGELWQRVVERWKMPLDEYGEAGMLCIGCFEALLGRKLTSADFTDAPINCPNDPTISDRFRDRLIDGGQR